ncbi:hypothetical protein HK405_014184 [Cladochytrium tenue]|nr:hypothetical protein HK405_014184 [Cladochytrium tenue]
MLDRNAGLKSRFTRYIDFEDWECSDCLEFTQKLAAKKGFAVDEAAWSALEAGFEELIRLPNFGNGRDVMTVWDALLETRAARVVAQPEIDKSIIAEDVKPTLSEVLKSKRPPERDISQPRATSSVDLLALIGSLPSFEMQRAERQEETPRTSRRQEAEELRQEEAVSKGGTTEEREKMAEDEGRDPGVSEAVWQELQKAKREHEEKLRRIKDEEERRTELARLEWMKERLGKIMKCPAGYKWYQCGGGWRCGGGSHYVSNAQLESQFTTTD